MRRKKSVDNCIIFSLICSCVCVWHFSSVYVLFYNVQYTFFFSLLSLQIHLVHLIVLLNCNQPIWNGAAAFNESNAWHITITTKTTTASAAKVKTAANKIHTHTRARAQQANGNFHTLNVTPSFNLNGFNAHFKITTHGQYSNWQQTVE